MAKDLFTDILFVDKVTDDTRTDNQFKELIKGLKKEYPITTPKYEVEFKKAYSSKRKYYFKRIENDYIIKFNDLINELGTNSTPLHLSFLYDKVYNRITNYLTQISNYISENNIDENLYLKPTNTDQSDEAYIISFLKANAIMLFLELQERFSSLSDADVYTIEEIHEVFFNEAPPKKKILIPYSGEKLETNKRVSKHVFTNKNHFGFKSRNTDALLEVLKTLQFTIDLLQNNTSIEDLHKLFTTDDFTKLDTKIYLQCETTQFSYVLDVLKPYFSNLKKSVIEQSGKFITKTGTPLKANNLYKNKVHNPKEKEVIDRIIQQLQ
ncbi:DUF6617 family protein [Aequorivita sp. KMM 9714]|uniref:DUF6617 family protein n=1 Tax=Aequorivita sp. KMM 9714 TaxID=2707173 RepID=UPI0013EB0E9A|nr:DUF6617 family protein [Aequorivita sp. KMM 9714]NGX84708.1 hypothetical protein [Aequorivita sp. KMM 9714]